MPEQTQTTIDRDKLTELLASDRGDGEGVFSKSDIKVLLDRLIKIFEECALNDTEISIRSFGKLKTHTIAARKGYDGIRKKDIDLPPVKRVTFRLAANIRFPLPPEE
jgi:nucleoid DNA-binding protein